MAFVAGAFTGFFFGVLLMALMNMAHSADVANEAFLQRMERDD